MADLPKKIKLKLWTSKQADEKFSKWVRARDAHCYFCHREGRQNSHFWGRGNSATRYHPLNCDAACGFCHMKHEGSKQGLYREMKIRQLGQEGYDSLERLARSIMKREDAIIDCMKLLKGI